MASTASKESSTVERRQFSFAVGTGGRDTRHAALEGDSSSSSARSVGDKLAKLSSDPSM